jgi:hypothetical protein
MLAANKVTNRAHESPPNAAWNFVCAPYFDRLEKKRKALGAAFQGKLRCATGEAMRSVRGSSTGDRLMLNIRSVVEASDFRFAQLRPAFLVRLSVVG